VDENQFVGRARKHGQVCRGRSNKRGGGERGINRFRNGIEKKNLEGGGREKKKRDLTLTFAAEGQERLEEKRRKETADLVIWRLKKEQNPLPPKSKKPASRRRERCPNREGNIRKTGS